MSSEYWADRFGKLAERQILSDEELIKELEELYKTCEKDIKGKIAYWYAKFAKNNEISMSEAHKLLNTGELEEFKWTVEEYIQHGEKNIDDGFTKQLVNASSKVHIRRYEALITELRYTAERIMGIQESKLTDHLKKAYKENYLHTAFEIQKGTGVGAYLGGVDERSLSEVIKKPWAVDGNNFSERIWNDRTSLVSEIDTQLKRNIALGKGPDEAANAIAKRFETSKSNAYRLVMTESAAISSRATEKCYNDLGVEEFEVLETLDSHTCEICGAMDGKHFPKSQYEIGITVPPFHPRCRGTTVPYFDDMDEYGERIARDLEGNTFYVPADTTYEQWKQMQDDKYGNGSVDKARKMAYNKSADLKLYEQYKDILKADAPVDFKSFRKLKYEDSQQWQYTKGLVDYLRKYPTSDKCYYDVQLKLQSLGIKKGIVLPPVQKQAYILPSGKHDPYHIMHRMMERNITDDNLRDYMRDAKIMLVQWGGKRQLFVGESGMCVIFKEDEKWKFKTAWAKSDYDEESDKILEVIKDVGL